MIRMKKTGIIRLLIGGAREQALTSTVTLIQLIIIKVFAIYQETFFLILATYLDNNY